MTKKRLFHYNPVIIFLLIITTIGLLIYSLGYEDARHFIQYFSYLYSTYSLIVVIFNIKRLYLFIKTNLLNTGLYKKTKNKLYKYKYLQKYFEDIRYRNMINLCLSSVIDFSFIFIKFVDGITSKSIWFISLAVYYFIITIIRLFLLNNLRKLDDNKEFIIYRNTGYLIMTLNIALVIMIFQMIRTNVAVVPSGYIIYLTALYSFYLIILAIVNVIKYKKYNSPILSSIKIINLLTACVSILMLQTTMIATFGDNNFEYMKLMNSITGGVISVITLAISTYMIIKGQKNKIRY